MLPLNCYCFIFSTVKPTKRFVISHTEGLQKTKIPFLYHHSRRWDTHQWSSFCFLRGSGQQADMCCYANTAAHVPSRTVHNNQPSYRPRSPQPNSHSRKARNQNKNLWCQQRQVVCDEMHLFSNAIAFCELCTEFPQTVVWNNDQTSIAVSWKFCLQHFIRGSSSSPWPQHEALWSSVTYFLPEARYVVYNYISVIKLWAMSAMWKLNSVIQALSFEKCRVA